MNPNPPPPETSPTPAPPQTIAPGAPPPAPAQHGQHPQSAQPQFGQPQYGQPQFGQPQFGQPQFGQPQFGQIGAGGIVTDAKPTDTGVIVLAWIAAFITLGYLIPWAVAVSRGKSNQGAIGLINLLLGWTFVGWVAALVMACMAHQAVGMGQPVIVAQQFTGPAPVTPQPAPGWYPAPDGAGQQYWDGVAWTGHRSA